MDINNNNNQLDIYMTLAEIIELVDPKFLEILSEDGYYSLLDNIFTDEETSDPYESLQGLYEEHKSRISGNELLDEVFKNVLNYLENH